MFIEIGLDGFEPVTLMTLRVLLAALLLVALMAVRGTLRRLRTAGWKAYAVGVINSAIPFTLFAWGQQYIDSGIAAIGNATVPIWVAILAIWFAHSERATGRRVAGIAVGLVGTVVLTGAQPDVDAWAVAGTLAVVLASILYAIAGIALQRISARLDPVTLTTATMIGATAVLLPFGVAQAPAEPPGWGPVAAVVALAIGGTAIGLLIFIRIISDYGAFRAGLVTYLLPVTALLYGALLLDEEITRWMIVGLVLILAGVALGSGEARAARAPDVAEPVRP
jgi:drug/metabolite transporter (DMT)-like permease